MSELFKFILDHEEAFKSKARLTSLYSDFSRIKTTNPDGYQANVSAWSSALAHANHAGIGLACGSNALSIQAGASLAQELESKNLGKPVAIGAVLDEAVLKGDMIPLHDFLHSTASIYDKPGWLPHIHIPTAWEVARWGLRQVGLGDNRTTLTDGNYVVKANIEAASRKVLKHLATSVISSTPTSHIYSLDTFTHTFSPVLSTSQHHHLSPSDIQILLKHLTRDLHACTISPSTDPSSTITTIKFNMPGSSSTSSAQLTTQDTTIAHLSTLHLALSTQIDKLNARLSTLESTLRASVATSSQNSTAKERTLAILRTRKSLTTTLSKRQSSLLQIETVLQSIDDAATQVDLVRAMQDSSTVLRDLNKQVGGVEGVEKVMDDLREEMEDVEDVGRIITEGNMGSVDEGEVEDELDALLEEKERETKKEAMKGMEDKASEASQQQHVREEGAASHEGAGERLPDVPNSEPGRVAERSAEAELENRLSLMSLVESRS